MHHPFLLRVLTVTEQGKRAAATASYTTLRQLLPAVLSNGKVKPLWRMEGEKKGAISPSVSVTWCHVSSNL
jgi:hypothetical protein